LVCTICTVKGLSQGDEQPRHGPMDCGTFALLIGSGWAVGLATGDTVLSSATYGKLFAYIILCQQVIQQTDNQNDKW